jgi:hypothetical protein
MCFHENKREWMVEKETNKKLWRIIIKQELT